MWHTWETLSCFLSYTISTAFKYIYLTLSNIFLSLRRGRNTSEGLYFFSSAYLSPISSTLNIVRCRLFSIEGKLFYSNRHWGHLLYSFSCRKSRLRLWKKHLISGSTIPTHAIAMRVIRLVGINGVLLCCYEHINWKELPLTISVRWYCAVVSGIMYPTVTPKQSWGAANSQTHIAYDYQSYV